GSTRHVLLALAAGLLLVVAALLPPTLNGDPQFATRYLHFASYGVIIILVSLGIAAERLTRAPALAASIAALVIGSWGVYLDSEATYWGEVGRQSRRFFYELHEQLPSVQEGTIVLLEDAPRTGDQYETFATPMFRAITNTHTTFFLSDAVMTIEQLPDRG